MNISQPSFRWIRPMALTVSAVLLTAVATAGPAGAAIPGGAALAVAGQAGGDIMLKDGHPGRYVVQRGDTLWDISAMFLRDPWYWPEIWYANPQVENPHLIYPDDILTLVYIDGQPQLRLERGMQAGGAERLSPKVREQPLEAAITTIPAEVIGAFLSRGTVLEKDEIDELPYVVAIREGHLIGSAGNDVYIRGGDIGERGGYSLVRVGEALIDPDDDKIVGYEGIFVGEGTIRRGGDPATMFVNDSEREVLNGDRLVDHDNNVPLRFYPRAPGGTVDGRIIHVVDGVSQIGQYQITVINRGAVHGLEPGHVLAIWQTGEKITDRFAGGLLPKKVRLPDERAGTLMIFRTYDRISYALIMEAVSEIHVLDKVRNPG